MASTDTTTPRAMAVIITADGGAQNILIDASERSPYTHEVLGGTPTFLGAWDGSVYMLGLANPNEGASPIDSGLIPSTGREPGNLLEPILLTRLDDEYRPVDFTVECLSRLTTAKSGTTS